MKKLLMLGGSDLQVTAIRKARTLGYEVITCDYLPNNPGHAYAHAYHNVSTTDLDAVLALARGLGVDGVSAYASDPAAMTAAYLCAQLGLPGDGPEAVRQIQDKELFRGVQHTLGIPAPMALPARDAEQMCRAAAGWKYGGIIKPVDTAGSKGVVRLHRDATPALATTLLQQAMDFSRAKSVIIEEFLPREGPQLTGDVLIVDGRIRFWCFGDVHFNDRVTGLVPRGVSIPASIPEEKIAQGMADLQRMLEHIGITQGVFNVDLFVDVDGRPILVDVGARNGGNMLNTLYHLHTGVDLIEHSLRLNMGEPVELVDTGERSRYVGHMVLHAEEDGVFEALDIAPELEPHIFHRSINVRPGDRVSRFVHSGLRLGLLLVEFPDKGSMLQAYANMHELVQARLRRP